MVNIFFHSLRFNCGSLYQVPKIVDKFKINYDKLCKDNFELHYLPRKLPAFGLDGKRLLGPNGKSLNIGHIVYGIDGKPVFGPDGKPVLMKWEYSICKYQWYSFAVFSSNIIKND